MINVAVLCPTYGRYQLLKRSIGFFLGQHLPEGVNAKMFVINDGEKPIFSTLPNVQIFNFSKRITLMTKRAMMFEHACETGYDLAVNWDDDDEYHTHYLFSAVDALSQNNNWLVAKPHYNCLSIRNMFNNVVYPVTANILAIHESVLTCNVKKCMAEKFVPFRTDDKNFRTETHGIANRTSIYEYSTPVEIHDLFVYNKYHVKPDYDFGDGVTPVC